MNQATIQHNVDEAILSAYEDLRDDNDVWVRIAVDRMVKVPTITNRVKVTFQGWTDMTLPNAARSHKMSVRLTQKI